MKNKTQTVNSEQMVMRSIEAEAPPTVQPSIQSVKTTGFIWRTQDNLAVWALTENGSFWIFKHELEKGFAYSVANRVKAAGKINIHNWNKVGFERRDQQIQHTEMPI